MPPNKVRQSAKAEDPLMIFRQAENFADSAQLLSQKSFETMLAGPGPGFSPVPAIVFEAFAIELYLKCLTILEKKKTSRTHSLERLFLALNLPTRQHVEQEWDRGIARMRATRNFDEVQERFQKESGMSLVQNFRDALKAGSNAFVEWRYFYENPASGWHLGSLRPILRDVIVKLKPDWDLTDTRPPTTNHNP